MADDRGEAPSGQDEAARLEAALSRIQLAAALRAARPAEPDGGCEGSEMQRVAARLDTLIAELRALLGPQV